jgi:hypothetical protein
MKLAGAASRLTIFLGESGSWHHRPLYTEIVHRAHQAGLARLASANDIAAVRARVARTTRIAELVMPASQPLQHHHRRDHEVEEADHGCEDADGRGGPVLAGHP